MNLLKIEYIIYTICIQGGDFLLDEINKTKEKLHREIEAKGLDHKQVLEISQELDELIVEHLKLENTYEKKNQ